MKERDEEYFTAEAIYEVILSINKKYKMSICYVSTNEVFEVVRYQDKLPNNFLENSTSYFKYSLRNNITIIVNYNSVGFSRNEFKALYEETVLRFEKGLKPVNVADLMNDFARMSHADIQQLVEKVQKETKSELECDIENLQNEKAALEEKVITLKNIIHKKDELFQLIKGLE